MFPLYLQVCCQVLKTCYSRWFGRSLGHQAPMRLPGAPCGCDLYPDGCRRGGWSSHHGLYDFMLAREARRHGRRPPVASSQAYPWRRDIVRFENPTRPPFLQGGQRQWRGWSYSPSELRYTPCPISRPRRSKSHSACFRMPSAHTYHGYLDDPPSEPFSVALFLGLLNTWVDAIPSPWMPGYADSWNNSTSWYYSLI